MATGAYTGQAVAVASRLCKQLGILPHDVYEQGYVPRLQQELLKTGQYIPELTLQDTTDLMHRADLYSSSALRFTGFSANAVTWKPLEIGAAQLIPMDKGETPQLSLPIQALAATDLTVELRVSARKGGFTPDTVIATEVLSLEEGMRVVSLTLQATLADTQYVFLTFLKNPQVLLPYTEQRITGLLSVFNGENKAVSNHGKQLPPVDSGIDEFEFWCPQRRPAGQNIAVQLSRPVTLFEPENLRNGIDRPVRAPNAWVADPADEAPAITVNWPDTQSISRIDLVFDTDTDHPMESVLLTHPETVMPFCVRNYRIEDASGRIVYRQEGNYQTRNTIVFDEPLVTDRLTIHLDHPSANVPAALFAVRCYGGAG